MLIATCDHCKRQIDSYIIIKHVAEPGFERWEDKDMYYCDFFCCLNELAKFGTTTERAAAVVAYRKRS